MRPGQSEMPIATRKAPPPPGSAVNQQNSTWSNDDLLGSLTMSQPVQKKKPPPRPPPPRFRIDPHHSEKSKKSNRPTELLSNLFGRKSTKQSQINVAFAANRVPPSHKSNHQSSNPHQSNFNNFPESKGSLIDLSPPESPTFTTRSSSDGVSVNSFGSDGNSNPSAFLSSGSSTSQTESAFEDDFDFFSGRIKQNTTQHDPWKIIDPFSPVPSNKSSSTNTMQVGDARFFAFNNGPSHSLATPPTTNNVTSMPTIIRARPSKARAPKPIARHLAPIVANFNAPINSNMVLSRTSSTSSDCAKWSTTFDEDNYQSGDYSPPMPTIPPPEPPRSILTENEITTESKEQEPQAVALYDYHSPHSGDLSFKKGDTIMLKSKVNDDWLEGQLGNCSGMFPTNFVKVIVPLPRIQSNFVNALFAFVGETWSDLPFEEGARINVLSKISDDWLYGEYNGQKGQFPATYVDQVPPNLTPYS